MLLNQFPVVHLKQFDNPCSGSYRISSTWPLDIAQGYKLFNLKTERVSNGQIFTFQSPWEPNALKNTVSLSHACPSPNLSVSNTIADASNEIVHVTEKKNPGRPYASVSQISRKRVYDAIIMESYPKDEIESFKTPAIRILKKRKNIINEEEKKNGEHRDNCAAPKLHKKRKNYRNNVKPRENLKEIKKNAKLFCCYCDKVIPMIPNAKVREIKDAGYAIRKKKRTNGFYDQNTGLYFDGKPCTHPYDEIKCKGNNFICSWCHSVETVCPQCLLSL